MNLLEYAMTNSAPIKSSAQQLPADLARRSLPMRGGHAPQPFLDGSFALIRGRVHEFCGPARTQLAAFLLQTTTGAVIWASPSWWPERLYPYGLMPFADPNRIIFARCRRPEDILWVMEESLRSGASPLVLADLPQPPALTPIRRLHLAAEAGGEAAKARGRPAPLAVILSPQSGGAQGVESRWHMQYAPSGTTLLEGRAAWRLARLRARDAPPAQWDITHAKGQISVSALPDAP